MGAMSDLHLLAERVIQNDETVEAVASDTTYSQDDIAWAVKEIHKA